jgi:hypothetical protein
METPPADSTPPMAGLDCRFALRNFQRAGIPTAKEAPRWPRRAVTGRRWRS